MAPDDSTATPSIAHVIGEYLDAECGQSARGGEEHGAIIEMALASHGHVVIDKADIPGGLIEQLFQLAGRVFVESDGRDAAAVAARLLGGDQ